jgi:predicted nucleotidyltransferase
METLELLGYSGAREMLETLLRFPKRQFTINELSRESGVPFASAWRQVRRWEAAGVIETGRVGRSVAVRLGESKYTRQMADVLRMSTSPQAFTVRGLKRMLAKDKGVKSAYLFGSVAKGDEELASDIDVALLAGRDFDASNLVFRVQKEYGTKIVPLVFATGKDLSSFLKGKQAAKIV